MQFCSENFSNFSVNLSLFLKIFAFGGEGNPPRTPPVIGTTTIYRFSKVSSKLCRPYLQGIYKITPQFKFRITLEIRAEIWRDLVQALIRPCDFLWTWFWPVVAFGHYGHFCSRGLLKMGGRPPQINACTLLGHCSPLVISFRKIAKFSTLVAINDHHWPVA